eukprot:1474590-Alexandrium_andersonii.AAC.1
MELRRSLEGSGELRRALLWRASGSSGDRGAPDSSGEPPERLWRAFGELRRASGKLLNVTNCDAAGGRGISQSNR